MAAQIGCDDAEPRRQRFRLRREIAGMARPAVQQDERLSRAPVLVVQPVAVPGVVTRHGVVPDS